MAVRAKQGKKTGDRRGIQEKNLTGNVMGERLMALLATYGKDLPGRGGK
jgi:hypothetical protein